MVGSDSDLRRPLSLHVCVHVCVCVWNCNERKDIQQEAPMSAFTDRLNTSHCMCLLLTVSLGYKRTRDRTRLEGLACRDAVFWNVTPWGLVDYTSVLERAAASSFISLVYPQTH